jgi:hypothetical protein
MGGTGQWPVPSGDPPDGTETGVQIEIQAKVSSVVQLFRSASRRPERAGRPFYPFFRQPLNAFRLPAGAARKFLLARASEIP